jgi:branched-chain amino acid transport system permease protein
MITGWSRRRLSGAARSWLSVSILLALVVAIASIWGNRSFTIIVTTFLIYTSMVVAYQMFMGNSGIVSFGHVAFFGIGAYTAALLNIPPEVKEVALPSLPTILQQTQTGALLAILIASVFSGLIALLIGIVISRMREDAMGIATFALLVIVYTVIHNWEEVTRGGLGLYDIPNVMTPVYALIGLTIILGVALLYKASPAGLRIQGAREDPLAAQSLGCHLTPVRLLCFVLSAMIMAAGGGMWAHNIRAFGPASFFFRDTFNMIAMMIIGGQASVTGAVAGSAVVAVVSELMRFPEKGMVIGTIQIPAIYGAVQLSVALIILVTLILRPSGIMGAKELEIPFSQWIKKLNKRIRK